MRDHVLVPFAEGLSLDVKTAFFVLDEYFSTNYNRLSHFNLIENHLDDVQRKMQQMQTQVQQFDMQTGQQKFETYRDGLLKLAATILFEAKNKYLEERKNLLTYLNLFVGLS